jgi:hypothetical protein
MVAVSSIVRLENNVLWVPDMPFNLMAPSCLLEQGLCGNPDFIIMGKRLVHLDLSGLLCGEVVKLWQCKSRMGNTHVLDAEPVVPPHVLGAVYKSTETAAVMGTAGKDDDDEVDDDGNDDAEVDNGDGDDDGDIHDS